MNCLKIKNLIRKLWILLENKFEKHSIYQKEKTHNEFLKRLENAKSCVCLFGLKFPNYFTTHNKIYTALKHLEKKNPKVKVKIFIPNKKIVEKLEKLNIYPHKENISRGNIYKIHSFQDDFEKLNIEIIEYNCFVPFGFSAIDVDLHNSFVHISKVKRNFYIKDSEFFNIYKNPTLNKLFIKLINIIIRSKR